jgi:septum formation protein
MGRSTQAGDAPSQRPPHSAGRLLLASQSPRRRRLLEWLGLPFATAEVDTAESLEGPLASNPPALAIALAAEKALAARETGLAEGALTLCFDTIVVLDGKMLGKPRDLADAWHMLRALSGHTHEVVTGVALLTAEQDAPSSFAVTTRVTMRDLSDADIEEWMRHGTFMGCAGAYNIEAQVAEVADSECYQNVAGMPLCHLYAALRDDPALAERLPAEPTCPVDTCDAALGRTCALGPRAVARQLG